MLPRLLLLLLLLLESESAERGTAFGFLLLLLSNSTVLAVDVVVVKRRLRRGEVDVMVSREFLAKLIVLQEEEPIGLNDEKRIMMPTRDLCREDNRLLMG